jgi:TetR/AcrR family transcriptional regulator
MPPADVSASALAAATRLFARRGFDATSLQDIATEVGVTKPAILHHFPSKEELRRAVFATILDHWREKLPAILLAATASEDRFDGVLGELRAFFEADPDRARLVVREMLDRPDEIRTLVAAHVRPWIAAVALYIDRGKEKGEHHADVDAEAYTVHALTLVISAVASEAIALGVLERPGVSHERARDRYAKELRRIARSSLFTERAAPVRAPATSSAVEPPRKGAPSARKRRER